jgi:hypothetical protein
MALGSTERLTEMNEYYESSCGVKGGLAALKADSLTAICEPIV